MIGAAPRDKETMMTTARIRLARLAIAAGLAVAAGGAAAQEYVLKFHHMWPTVGMGHMW